MECLISYTFYIIYFLYNFLAWNLLLAHSIASIIIPNYHDTTHALDWYNYHNIYRAKNIDPRLGIAQRQCMHAIPICKLDFLDWHFFLFTVTVNHCLLKDECMEIHLLLPIPNIRGSHHIACMLRLTYSYNPSKRQRHLGA